MGIRLLEIEGPFAQQVRVRSHDPVPRARISPWQEPMLVQQCAQCLAPLATTTQVAPPHPCSTAVLVQGDQGFGVASFRKNAHPKPMDFAGSLARIMINDSEPNGRGANVEAKNQRHAASPCTS
ncbi:MAG: hypothetical protein F4Z67_03105 [Synechococcus sp. SB0667_bin_8]|nr:hypothetical protein [Cyanobacteria bacterium MAG IRC3_bin_20]MXX08619.1 hypothetical protein [Synechococcus sp. SB0667_bin_8]